MNNPLVYFILHFRLLLFALLAHHQVLANNYVPTDKILLSCGGPPESIDTDGRKWFSDIGSKFIPTSTSSTFPAAVRKPSVPEVPYMNARLSRSPYTYTFPVAPGRKFIRLYFYPASYSGFNASNAIFSVTAGPYMLMKNFSAAQTSEALKYDYMMKEFSLNLPSLVLHLTFTPASDPPNSYAFVNGIEVVSHPDIYNTVAQNAPFSVDNTTALENFYRVNVGGSSISPSQDTGLFRSWNVDSSHIFGAASGVTEAADPDVTIGFPSGTPSYVAPLDVYATFRAMGPNPNVNLNYYLTWVFHVDSGFYYLIRLHFCEGFKNITLINQRVFDIFLNNQTAQEAADVIAWGRTNGVALHRDYVVFVPNGTPQQDIWLALHPNPASGPSYYDAILNGVEIFKVNDTAGNLGGLSPTPAQLPDIIS